MKPKILLASGEIPKESYTEAVTGCDGVPYISYCPQISSDYDGLILCGGGDILPSYYNEDINGSVKIDKNRDIAEFALVKAFVDMKKPVMGICRGCQLLNIFFGGSLFQHLSNADVHSSFGNGDLVHSATAVNNSFIQKMYGENFNINSAHHQGINQLGDDLEAVLYSSDGVVEAIIHKTLPIFGVQFHPERMSFSHKRDDTVDGKPIFEYFINLCKANKKGDVSK